MKYILTLLLLTNIFAQTTSGSIDIEEYKKKKPKAPTELYETNGIAYITNLETMAKSNSIKPIPDLDEGSIKYLTALYLFCSINSGVSPEILDTILTHDLINSAANKKNDCLNMKAFWKEWIANDMEKRHSFGTKMGFANETANFKKNIRTQYIRCSSTIKKKIATPYIRKESISKTLNYAQSIKEKEINIFIKLGLN